MFGLFKSKDQHTRTLTKFIRNSLHVNPKNINLYRDAVRHKSIAKETNKVDNERLEFLGDAVLDIIVAEQLYEMYPGKREGELTQLKARIVNRKTLGSIGVDMGLEKIVEFVDGKYVNKNTICGNALEALVGAIYVDKGFEATKSSVRGILSKYLDYESIVRIDPDFKSQILVWSQKRKQPISFHEVRVEDLGHEKMYYIEIRFNNNIIGEGKGKSKKSAEQEASKNALKYAKNH